MAEPQARYNRWARLHPAVRGKEAAAQRERRKTPAYRQHAAAYHRQYRRWRQREAPP